MNSKNQIKSSLKNVIKACKKYNVSFSEILNELYTSKSYNEGYDVGHEDGFNSGHEVGYNSGLESCEE